jgi:hypothetical protein
VLLTPSGRNGAQLRNGLGSDHWCGLDRDGKGRKKPARLAKSGTLTLLTNRWSQVSANLGVARSRPTSKLDFANVSTLAQVLRPPGCDTKSCRYQKSFFRSCPNPLLPILRPHGFSLCLLRSMRLRRNVRTQLPRFQRHQPSDSSANLGVPAVRSAMRTRYVLALGVVLTVYACQRSLRFVRKSSPRQATETSSAASKRRPTPESHSRWGSARGRPGR